MPTLRDTVRQTLEGDATLATILTGGIFDASELPQDEGGADVTPRETDGVTIKPYATIRWRAANQYQPEVHKIGAERETFEVYMYQDTGYAIIEQAKSRIKDLLNDKYFTVTDRAIAHVLYVTTSGEVPADELGGAPCRFSRYQVIDVD